MVCEQVGISGIHIGGRTFSRLGIQGQLNGYSVRNMFEISFTEEVMGAGKDVLEGVFKFAASESRNKFDRKSSAARGENGEKSGSDWVASNQVVAGDL